MKKFRKFEVGLLHKEKGGELKQVRQPNGGGTRTLRMDTNVTVAELMTKAQEIFFGDEGFVKLGHVDEYDLSMQLFAG